MPINIEKYRDEYKSQLTDLLTAFQGYLQYIDPLKVRSLTPEYGEQALQTILTEVESKEGVFYIALDEGKAAGFIVGVIESLSDLEMIGSAIKKPGKIMQLYLDTEYRGKGLGTTLVREVEKYFISKSCDATIVSVFLYNEGARSLYQKLGYSERELTFLKKL